MPEQVIDASAIRSNVARDTGIVCNRRWDKTVKTNINAVVEGYSGINRYSNP